MRSEEGRERGDSIDGLIGEDEEVLARDCFCLLVRAKREEVFY